VTVSLNYCNVSALGANKTLRRDMCKLLPIAANYPGFQNRQAFDEAIRGPVHTYIHKIYLNKLYPNMPPVDFKSSSEFLATDPEVPGSIPGASRFSENHTEHTYTLCGENVVF
jgi:hypothetical protein